MLARGARMRLAPLPILLALGLLLWGGSLVAAGEPGLDPLPETGGDVAAGIGVPSSEDEARAVIEALQSSPFGEELLPPGFSNPRIGTGASLPHGRPAGIASAVFVLLDGPDPSASLYYAAYRTDEQARAAFAGLAQYPPLTVELVEPEGFDFPARCVTFKTSPDSFCVVLMGQLEVGSHARAFVRPDEEDAEEPGRRLERAIALVQAAVHHLKRVQEQMAAPGGTEPLGP